MSPDNAKHWYLKQIDILKDLSEEEIEYIGKSMEGKEFFCKELLYTPYSDVYSIYMLKHGEITIYYSHEGKKLILDVLTPGSLFGNLSFQENKSPHFAEASKDAFVCAFSRKDFLHIFEKNPELVFKLFEYTSKRMNEYEEKMRSILLNAKDKVLNQLQILAKKQRRLFQFFSTPALHISHEKLAEHIGISRETVTRALQDLKKEGLLIIDDKGGIILS